MKLIDELITFMHCSKHCKFLTSRWVETKLRFW